jgi:rhodanese-related sulfurtransferase
MTVFFTTITILDIMNKFKAMLFTLMILSLFNANAKVGNLTPIELLEAQQKGIVVIDIRTPEEWQEVGTVPGAKRIMFFDQQRKPQISDFMVEFEKVVTSKGQPFILVCRSGSRTATVTSFLDQSLGYTNGAHLSRGMKKWIAEKHEVEKNKEL